MCPSVFCRLFNIWLLHLCHWLLLIYVHFAWVVDDAKCILVAHVCVSVCLSVCLSFAAFPHYCTDPDVTWGNGSGCRLVVQYWAYLQSVHRFRCYGNIAQNTKCQRVLVLALCLVVGCEQRGATLRRKVVPRKTGEWPQYRRAVDAFVWLAARRSIPCAREWCICRWSQLVVLVTASVHC